MSTGHPPEVRFVQAGALVDAWIGHVGQAPHGGRAQAHADEGAAEQLVGRGATLPTPKVDASFDVLAAEAFLRV